MKYYFDTSIWLDIYEGRNEVVRRVVRKIVLRRDDVLFSDAVLGELKALGYGYELRAVLERAEVFVEKVHVSRSQTDEARLIASRLRIPLRDALHAILARDNAAVLISRDRHFTLLQGMVEVKRPEELLE